MTKEQVYIILQALELSYSRLTEHIATSNAKQLMIAKEAEFPDLDGKVTIHKLLPEQYSITADDYINFSNNNTNFRIILLRLGSVRLKVVPLNATTETISEIRDYNLTKVEVISALISKDGSEITKGKVIPVKSKNFIKKIFRKALKIGARGKVASVNEASQYIKMLTIGLDLKMETVDSLHYYYGITPELNPWNNKVKKLKAAIKETKNTLVQLEKELTKMYT
jgi:hypothetical protein